MTVTIKKGSKNMQEQNNKPVVIGVSGLARAGKDTFVKVASKILKENGYTSEKFAFADTLKNELESFIRTYYGLNVWTDNTNEKNVIRPILVAHGCQKRMQTDGKYWIDSVDELIINSTKDVIFISDCRFPNEIEWLHDRWDGWFVHLKKYSIDKRYYEQTDPDCTFYQGISETKIYDKAPNEEEAKNDPICEKNADYKLELENIVEREHRLKSIKKTLESLIDNTYLNEEIKLCLTKCPFLTIK